MSMVDVQILTTCLVGCIVYYIRNQGKRNHMNNFQYYQLKKLTEESN
jgi:hypothetical protein